VVKQKKKKKLKKGRGRAALIVLVLILILSGITFIGYKVLRVAKIEVTGIETVSSDYVVELSKINIGEHLFKIDKNKIEKNIESDPYLEFVSLDIKYPNEVSINIKERTEAAAVKAVNMYIYIDINGYVLKVAKADEENSLIIINGIDVAKYEIGDKINFSDELRFNAVTEILSGIYEGSLNGVITSIDLSNINNIVLQESGGIKIKFGQSDNVEKKMQWIKGVLDNLSEQSITSGTIDVSTGETAYYSPENG